MINDKDTSIIGKRMFTVYPVCKSMGKDFLKTDSFKLSLRL